MDGPSWTYGGDKNGEHLWSQLSHLYVTCESGSEQSPINITSVKPSQKAPLAFAYKPAAAEVKFENFAVTVRMKEALTLSVDGKNYTLESLSFHVPGEHMVNGEFYMLEIEMLHRDKDGNRLFVSVFGQEGAANPTLGAILQNPALTFDPSGLLPAQRGYYAYRGSLTYPPCTEGVEWRVLKTPITISPQQLEKIGEISGRNSRLTQLLNAREVEETN